MKNTVFPISIICFMLLLGSCISKKEIAEVPVKQVALDTIRIDTAKQIPYRASESRINDLLHTKLEVSFDWDSTYLYGKANLTFTPYFYPTNELKLDAKGFQIHEVAMVDSIGVKTPLKYTYDSLILNIDLAKTYHKTDTYEIFIDYTAMPNKLDEGGSAAISSDKGLYFINPDGSEKNKPKQIWTQGETEASSCWFPTIDAPNERTTQEIFMTVDSAYKTLSNGTLMFQTENGDGSRTDYWKQDLPHAPYLFMMAVGDFAEVKDEWRGMPVHYFVEPKYREVAKEIYPHTVEMLEFFSNKLDYAYPWDKYHQIVVRDYVSGAMENTGAVVFGDFIQGNKRFLIDNSGEDIVAHELIHHWFGDLVTCESWSNLPLNEAFATYGEYLWLEHKYGKDYADYHGYNDLRAYFQTSRISKKNLIRFHYEHRMEMFDANTYQRGGRVLHMLRTYVGDEAFFASLNYYLKENEYTAVEIHDLRLAFEKITGKDLNWFFNQWFLGAGHPKLKVEKVYNDSLNILSVKVIQQQDNEKVPYVFKLPTSLEIVHANGEKEIKDILINQRTQSFSFEMDEAPLLVNLDADKNLMADIEQGFSINETAVLYRKGGNFMDRYIAIKMLKRNNDSLSNTIKKEALSDDFWKIRQMAIEGVNSLVDENPDQTQKRLKQMAQKDEKSDVRAAAISALSKHFNEDLSATFFEEGTNDSSYFVVSAAIEALYEKDSVLGLQKAKALESLNSSDVQSSIADIYAKDGSPEHLSFFKSKIDNAHGFELYVIAQKFGKYLLAQDNNAIEEALPTLKNIAIKKETWWMRMAALNSIVKINKRFEEKVKTHEKKMEEAEIETASDKSKAYQEHKRMYNLLQSTLKEIKETETNENLLRMINSNINGDK